MKKYNFYSLLFLVCMIVACSSNSDKDTPEIPEKDSFIPASSSAVYFDEGMDFTSTGGSVEITFTTNKGWKASIPATDLWCSVNQLQGDAGTPTVVVSATANDTDNERTTAVTFTAGSISKQIKVTQQKPKNILAVTFPADFTPQWATSVAGKEVTITNPLYVTQTYNGTKPQGTVIVSSEIKRAFVEVNNPSTTDYPQWVEKHDADKLTLATDYSLVDASTTLRIGSELKGVKGKVTYGSSGYRITLTDEPVITYNSRSAIPTVNDYNLKVMSFNAENYYMSGNTDNAESLRQHAKILAALKEAKADVYAICEVEQGDFTVNYLCEALNRAVGEERYAWLNTSGQKTSKVQTNVFIYDKTKVVPYKDFKSYSFDNLKMRYIAQCFELTSNKAKVILAMNHLKAKTSGTDKNDGQGAAADRRASEARECLKAYNELSAYYGDADVLVLGDLNSYSMEDAVKVFTDAGYKNLLKEYSPEAWSYVYRGEVGYLDHSLSSQTLTTQVVGATPWDINASEPAYFGFKYTTFYNEDPYRCSDHNPIITWINLKE